MLHFWIIVAADKQLAAWQPTRSPGNSTNAFYNPSPYLPPSLCPVLSCLIAMPFTAVKQNVRDKLKSEPGSCSRSWSGVSWLGASWQLGLATPTCMQICSSPQAATRHVNFGGRTQTSRRRRRRRRRGGAGHEQGWAWDDDDADDDDDDDDDILCMNEAPKWNAINLANECGCVSPLPCRLPDLAETRERQLQYSDDNVLSSALPLASNYPTSVSKFHSRLTAPVSSSLTLPFLPSLNTRYTHNNRDVNHLKFSRESAVWLAAPLEEGVNRTAAKV